MARKYKLELTAVQMECLIDALTTLECMDGSGGEENDDGTWSDPFNVANRRIKRNMKAMFKKNGYKHPYNE